MQPSNFQWNQIKESENGSRSCVLAQFFPRAVTAHELQAALGQRQQNSDPEREKAQSKRTRGRKAKKKRGPE